VPVFEKLPYLRNCVLESRGRGSGGGGGGLTSVLIIFLVWSHNFMNQGKGSDALVFSERWAQDAAFVAQV
jgi:hypothetical protein